MYFTAMDKNLRNKIIIQYIIRLAQFKTCIECFQFADDLHSQNRFLEASKLYKWVFENASNLMKTDMGKAYNTEDRELLNRRQDRKEDDGTIVIELRVAKDDMGKVIGKKGRIAKSIRAVVKTAAMKQNLKTVVDIVE